MVSVEDFRDLSKSDIAQVRGKAIEPVFDLAHRRDRRIGHRQLREEKRARKPRPHRSLVVGTVAAPAVSLVSTSILMVIARKRP